METLESILVGIDGSERGKKALKWAARLANREGAHLTLLAVIDPASNELVGSDHRVLREAVENVLGEAQDFVRGDYPELAMDASYVSGDIVEALVGLSPWRFGCRTCMGRKGSARFGFGKRSHGGCSRRLGPLQRGQGYCGRRWPTG